MKPVEISVFAVPSHVVFRPMLENPDHVRVTRRWKGKGEERQEFEMPARDRDPVVAMRRAAAEGAAVLEATNRGPVRARGLLRRNAARVPAG
jgi:hypothetical protein